MNNKKLDRINNLGRSVIELLDSHGLLEVLVKKEYTKNILCDIELDENEINEIKSAFIKQNKLNDEEDYTNWLAKEGITEEQFIADITKPLKLAKFCDENFSPKAQARFLQRKNDLDQVIYSLIRVNDPFLAKELVFQLQGKESSFEDLAKKYSQGIEKHSKGIVGPIGLSKSHPTVSQLLRSATPGKIMGPFSVGDFSIILRLESLQEAKLTKEMEQEMSKELFEEWLNEESQEIIKNLNITNQAQQKSKEEK